MLLLSLQKATAEKLAGKRRTRSKIGNAHALPAAEPERLVKLHPPANLVV
jgi:hypothetical protein